MPTCHLVPRAAAEFCQWRKTLTSSRFQWERRLLHFWAWRLLLPFQLGNPLCRGQMQLVGFLMRNSWNKWKSVTGHTIKPVHAHCFAEVIAETTELRSQDLRGYIAGSWAVIENTGKRKLKAGELEQKIEKKQKNKNVQLKYNCLV